MAVKAIDGRAIGIIMGNFYRRVALWSGEGIEVSLTLWRSGEVALLGEISRGSSYRLSPWRELDDVMKQNVPPPVRQFLDGLDEMI